MARKSSRRPARGNSSRHPSKRPQSHGRTIERLEARNLLTSVVLQGIPTWIDEGPQPVINAGNTAQTSGNPTIPPNNPVAGSVEAIAVNPNNPAQIYVAGELSDPHGTHRTCAEAIYEAVRQVRARAQNFEVWLYRGAWEEWEPHEIDRP